MADLIRVTPKDYGALGDGVTDDTAAIKKAIAAVLQDKYRKTLFFTPGDYVFSEQLVLDNINVEGVGWNHSILTLKAPLAQGTPAILIKQCVYEYKTQFRGLRVRTGYTQPSQNGVAIKYGKGTDGIQLNGSMVMEDVMVRGFDSGIVFNGSQNTLMNVWVQQCYYGVYYRNDQGDNSMINCRILGNSFASIGCTRMRDTLISHCSLGTSPYGIYQEAFSATTGVGAPDFVLFDVMIKHVGFEGMGNGVIYSENWSVPSQAGIIDTTFEHVGFSWGPALRLANRPADYAIQVGFCKGINRYYPGAAPFSKGAKGIFYVHGNNAIWQGHFQLDDFTFGAGYNAGLFPEAQRAVTTNGAIGGAINATVIKKPGLPSSNRVAVQSYAELWLYLDKYVGIANSAQTIALPKNFRFSDNPVKWDITANSTGIPNSNINIASRDVITITPPSGATFNGLIKLEGFTGN
ncbi:glycosyl hydrolase family 28-related protein [Paenibacillus allorhizosphaerae]|uniref:Rhamnogalacturonase A/B/Epimerase-like pectate lyase domain-containing protein n=1 Tax=Paenibacillus allorhizosphaerae TaxID=2849866 RepID=A0ABM8VJC9_9BACL|nr:glycosyl hydrolase family 28-related protein [Paenibacillus allorhizosphaerae]CAG7645355.1 hypothetical protein PAECIP111802_03496 [Paenibacillus allorhizosphaerae]